MNFVWLVPRRVVGHPCIAITVAVAVIVVVDVVVARGVVYD